MKKLAISILAIFMVATTSGCSLSTQRIVERSVQKAVSESINEATDGAISDSISEITSQAVAEAIAASDFGAMVEFVAATVNESMNEAMSEINSDSMRKIMAEDIREAMADVDYDDFDMTKKQKIEIWSADESQLLRTITDNREIIDYVRNEHIEDWQFFSEIPKDAEVLYKIVYWRETTKTAVNPNSKLVISARDTLYKTSDGNYYIHTEVAGIDIVQLVAHIPKEVGQFLIGVAEGDEILLPAE
ncbi:hypothetical protein SAMN05661091_4174 [Paenibacillus uliginis N3/975]|uniref:Lipoprotein n=1 Tax=Paenibacillus uliginis N3/975 TaxID=1313296 RepID=A0A1X7HKZ0_9BACL|nr:hypothetical protein [Paenibacillus uliginis]SMF88199.1 hypothetical protein SAMN05661091_4174 [Paenibacillus uliginis N3/975]